MANKTLSLLRHAKAVPGDHRMDDQSRPLSEVGREDVSVLGALCQEEKITFDYVLCSHAVRTRETAELLFQTHGTEASIAYEERLYLATPGECLTAIQSANDAHHHVLLIGHNPGLHQLAHMLSAHGKIKDELTLGFPTCAFLTLDFEISHWKDIAAEAGIAARYHTPKTN